MVYGAVWNQGAVVNCRFDPTLHGRGLILRGVRVSSGLIRINFAAHLRGYALVQGRRL